MQPEIPAFPADNSQEMDLVNVDTYFDHLQPISSSSQNIINENPYMSYKRGGAAPMQDMSSGEVKPFHQSAGNTSSFKNSSEPQYLRSGAALTNQISTLQLQQFLEKREEFE